MSNQKKFDLSGNFKSIFKSTNPEIKLKSSPVVNINAENLIPFKSHPFKLYEGERFADMIESIKTNGVIIPIIVRPIDDETYEILSGHNRVEGAKAIGLETVPAIIREDLSDEEALLVVTETNLIQRSFSDLSHSERAVALDVRHSAIKNQGKRTDLIDEIENLLKTIESPHSNADNQTCSQVGNKLKSIEKIGQQYGLSKNSVARYLRINNLIEPFKKAVDDNILPFLAAVELSYISEAHQHDLFDVLEKSPELKIDIKRAAILREFSENKKLTPKVIEDILSGVAVKKKNRASLPVQSLKIGGKVLSKYFKPEQRPEEIQAELFEALEFYRSHK